MPILPGWERQRRGAFLYSIASVASLIITRHHPWQYIPVATTRPETILGDAALCVHPLDDRFKHFVGRQVRVPMTDRLIPGQQ